MAYEPSYLEHVGLGLPQEQLVKLDCLSRPQCGLDIAFAPIPKAWPAIYCCLHLALDAGRLDSLGWPDLQAVANQIPGPDLKLSLVDCEGHARLGTWTAADLWEHIHGQHQEVCSPQTEAAPTPQFMQWSPDGRHLAVMCSSCVMVMTFEGPTETTLGF